MVDSISKKEIFWFASIMLIFPIFAPLIFGAVNYINTADGSNQSIGDVPLFIDNTNLRIGVGTTTPNEKLVVIGNINVTGIIYQDGNAVQLESSAYKKANLTIDYPNLDTDSTNDLSLAALDNATIIRTGNITNWDRNAGDDWNSANASLFLDNTTIVRAGNNSFVTSISGWTDSGSAVVLTTISDKVGIGVSNPSQKLAVAGTVNATNFTLASVCADGQVLKFSNGFAVCGADSTGGSVSHS